MTPVRTIALASSRRCPRLYRSALQRSRAASHLARQSAPLIGRSLASRFQIATSCRERRWQSTSSSPQGTGPGAQTQRSSSGTHSVTPTERYNHLVSSGILRDDPHQQGIIARLQHLHDELRSFSQKQHSQPSSPKSFFARLFSTSSNAAATAAAVPKGLYLYGDVGTGKSMLMDLFYDTLPPEVRSKRRVHFHAFMVDVHKAIHASKAGGAGNHDPIPGVARDLARNASVLCFDEFQVTDIVDAMILRRLLESLMQAGVVCVMTSNRHPDDLYKNGIQRSSFIPCIELLKERFHVVDLDSPTDYRKIPRALSKVYFDPLSRENRTEIEKLFNAFAGKAGKEIVRDRTLSIWGRKLRIPESAGTTARFSFQQLCGQPLSAADYIEVTREFETIFVTDVPSMGLGQKDMARRFITFIDACYESKTKLFVSSEVPITRIFSSESSSSSEISDHQRGIMDDLGLNVESIGKSSIFTGEEEIFAFARACSRLVQMGTKEWAEAARG
ncbi:ATPase [Ceratobasidium sp. AG-Ba]|nr:ATPase [Ceratobasidium sp. AG-Ba]QRW01929.1 ATPase [Ceratobasidium sp. AG-Ba]